MPNHALPVSTQNGYSASHIAAELDSTALGTGHHGNALRVAKDVPGVTDEDRAVLDRFATGLQRSTDHARLQDIAIKVRGAGGDPIQSNDRVGSPGLGARPVVAVTLIEAVLARFEGRERSKLTATIAAQLVSELRGAIEQRHAGYVQGSRAAAAAPGLLEPAEFSPEFSPPPQIVATAHERIYLDIGDACETLPEGATFGDLHDLTWSADNASGRGIGYVRADLVAPHAQAPSDHPHPDFATEGIYKAPCAAVP